MKNLRITLITCICIFATYSFTFSQNKVVHEKKTFIADNGKIYWNKNLPVFINLSTSENGDGITMKEESKEKMEPFYFDTEGINWIRTRWAVNLETGEAILPKREIMWPILADGKAPVTKIRYHYTGKHVINGKTYYSGDLKISFNSQDAVSGIDAIYYSLGNGFKKYDDEFTIENEDDWNLQFYAVDKVGNVESPEKNRANQSAIHSR